MLALSFARTPSFSDRRGWSAVDFPNKEGESNRAGLSLSIYLLPHDCSVINQTLQAAKNVKNIKHMPADGKVLLDGNAQHRPANRERLL